MPRVATLIDGDNIGSDFSARIIATGRGLGDAHLLRAYANASNGSGWNDVPGVRLIHAGTGKNAADLLLAIDAMELACEDRFDAFVIASSDGDFTHLATRLRERGHEVVGIGEPKAPAPFRAACSRFEVLTPPGPTAAVVPSHGVSALDQSIRQVIKRNSANGSGIRLSDLNARLREEHEVRISDRPERTWRAYLGQRPALYDLDPRGPDARVRFLPSGFNS